MKYLSQRDAQWAADRLGASDLTMGKFGCTTTCVAMVSDDFGCYKSPLELAHNAANYTPSGLILWNKLNDTFKNQMRFVWRGYGTKGAGYISPMTDFTPLDRVLTNPNQRVILQVSDGAHWIKLTGKKGKDWKAIDPWTGKDCLVLATYRNITGYAIFEDIDKTQVATAQMNNTLAKRLAGRLLICPDQRGRLYYVDINGKLQGLGTTPEEVQQKAGKLALGISAVDISSLPWGDGSVAK